MSEGFESQPVERAPSIAVYYKRTERLERTPGGTKLVEVPNETTTGSPLPCGSRIKGKLKLSSELDKVPRDKSIVTPNDKRVDNRRTLRKDIICPKANDKTSGSLLSTRYGVWYQMIAVI